MSQSKIVFRIVILEWTKRDQKGFGYWFGGNTPPNEPDFFDLDLVNVRKYAFNHWQDVLRIRDIMELKE
jgi:hypothetical protein